MDPFSQAVEKIINEQRNVIGPLAIEQAKKVSGLNINTEGLDVSFTGNKTEILGKLVEQYQKLFGQTSVQVCRDAARPFTSKLPPQEVPALLR